MNPFPDAPQLPRDTNTERAIVAALVVDPSHHDFVAQEVTWTDFFDEQLGKLYNVLRLHHASGYPAGDIVGLQGFLEASGCPEEVRTSAFLGRLIGEGLPAHVIYYAKQIRRCSSLRKVILAAERATVDAYAAGGEPGKVLADLTRQLESIERPVNGRLISLADAGTELLDEIERIKEHGQAGAGVPYGFYSLDSQVGAMRPSEVTILAARTGIGKTSFACQVIKSAAKIGKRCLLVSLEMNSLEIATRIICGEASVNARHLRAGTCSVGDLANVAATVRKLGPLPIWFFSPPTATVEQIAIAAKVAAARNGLDLIVVDYIGYVRPTNPRESRPEQIAHVSRSLKGLARELSVPALVLCQLNREADKEPPRLSHLRDSGSIEQDADCVILLHTPDETHEDQVNLIVAKHRYSTRMMCSLRFVGSQTRFVDPKELERKENANMFDAFNNQPQSF